MDNTQLRRDLPGTLATMRDLGASIVKVSVSWASIAPQQFDRHYSAAGSLTDPSRYPAGSWSFLDDVDRQATADGLKVGFLLTGPAPRWAVGKNVPKNPNCHPSCRQWKPSSNAFRRFAQAIATRFDGSYTPAGEESPLPRVSWWSVWNEPNYGTDLAPQVRDHNKIELSPAVYRGLLNAAWRGLLASGHTTSTDTILFGETAPRGRTHPAGNFSGVKPLRFLRALYCVDVDYRKLRGHAAAVRGCPTGAAGSRRFRTRNPALFTASGFADHPYSQGVPPNLPTYACGRTFCVNRRTHRSDPDYADFARLGRLGRVLDRLVSAYGSHVHFPIWNTEFGYFTNPPSRAKRALPARIAALYMNWAEYLSYRNPRIRSYAQYLLADPVNGVFSDGLELASGQPATFSAFQMPVYMPVTKIGAPKSVTVWGAVRPAAYSLFPVTVEVEFKPFGSDMWTVLTNVAITNLRGYFHVSLRFSDSGSLRTAWTSPDGQAEYSRTQAVRVS